MATIKEFYGRDAGPHQFSTVKGVKVYAGWVLSDTHLFLLHDISSGARDNLIELSENAGLTSMLLSGEVRSFDKRQHTIERDAVRAVQVDRDDRITVHTDEDCFELSLGTSSAEVGRRIASEVLPDFELVEAPDEVKKATFFRSEKVVSGRWLLYHQPGWK